MVKAIADWIKDTEQVLGKFNNVVEGVNGIPEQWMEFPIAPDFDHLLSDKNRKWSDLNLEMSDLIEMHWNGVCVKVLIECSEGKGEVPYCYPGNVPKWLMKVCSDNQELIGSGEDFRLVAEMAFLEADIYDKMVSKPYRVNKVASGGGGFDYVLDTSDNNLMAIYRELMAQEVIDSRWCEDRYVV